MTENLPLLDERSAFFMGSAAALRLNHRLPESSPVFAVQPDPAYRTLVLIQKDRRRITIAPETFLRMERADGLKGLIDGGIVYGERFKEDEERRFLEAEAILDRLAANSMRRGRPAIGGLDRVNGIVHVASGDGGTKSLALDGFLRLFRIGTPARTTA